MKVPEQQGSAGLAEQAKTTHGKLFFPLLWGQPRREMKGVSPVSPALACSRGFVARAAEIMDSRNGMIEPEPNQKSVTALPCLLAGVVIPPTLPHLLSTSLHRPVYGVHAR